MKKIRELFDQTVRQTDAEWDLFSSKLIKREIPKRTVFLKMGQTEKYLSFVEKGIVRLFVPKETDDLTFAFVFEGNFVSAYDSFLTQSPSGYAVETLTETVLWSISHRDLQEIYEKTQVGNQIGRAAAEGLYLKKAKRELSLLNETPEERYLKLFSEQAHLLKYIPLKYIASYIGVTPQALSRIRRRIS